MVRRIDGPYESALLLWPSPPTARSLYDWATRSTNNLRLNAPAAPTRPMASMPKDAGSGAGVSATEFTVNPSPAAQPPPMVFVSSVTAPFRAIALPQPMVAPVSKVMLWAAIRSP
jgi:hypothetical protein